MFLILNINTPWLQQVESKSIKLPIDRSHQKVNLPISVSEAYILRCFVRKMCFESKNSIEFYSERRLCVNTAAREFITKFIPKFLHGILSFVAGFKLHMRVVSKVMQICVVNLMSISRLLCTGSFINLCSSSV